VGLRLYVFNPATYSVAKGGGIVGARERALL
jgi:hypothetical protein